MAHGYPPRIVDPDRDLVGGLFRGPLGEKDLGITVLGSPLDGLGGLREGCPDPVEVVDGHLDLGIELHMTAARISMKTIHLPAAFNVPPKRGIFEG